MQTKEQGQVAVNAFLFQFGGGADTFPGGGDLDQDAFARNTGGFVLGDQRATLGDGRCRIPGEPRIDFR